MSITLFLFLKYQGSLKTFIDAHEPHICLLIEYRYADSANAYWTGYFTSRPALKRYVRVLSGYYVVRHSISLSWSYIDH